MIPYAAHHVANTSAKHATSAQYHGCRGDVRPVSRSMSMATQYKT